LYTPVLSVLSKKKSFVNQNCKINKGAWRYCINDLVTAYAVKVVIFCMMQFCPPSAMI
jgi:hypothetical protein